MPTPTETPVPTETPTPTETPAPINTPTIRPPRGLHPAGPDAEGRFPYDPGDRALPDSLQTLSAENLSEV